MVVGCGKVLECLEIVLCSALNLRWGVVIVSVFGMIVGVEITLEDDISTSI